MRVENSKMIYRGSNGLSKVYRGQTVVWQQGDVDYSRQYLTMEVLSLTGTSENYGELYFGPANENYTNPLPFRDIEFSINNGEWKFYSSATTEDKRMYVGDIVRFRGTNSEYSWSAYLRHYELGIVNSFFSLYGNIMSLVYGNNFYGNNQLLADYCFLRLFDGNMYNSYGAGYSNHSYCKTAEHLILPATTLTIGCYSGLFNYQVYLEKAPKLNATTLSDGCYGSMFSSCRSLSTAPDLPATQLVYSCYNGMFVGCGNLSYIKCLATDLGENPTEIGGPTYLWMSQVPSGGVFVKNPQMTSWPTGVSGIPEGWTVVDDNT